MRVTECVDGDAGGKIQISLAVRRGEPAALAVVKRKVDTRESRQ
jgi:hypothetical protein